MYNAFSRNNSTHEDWKIVDRFDSTYWSGLDLQVYFNNILINEAIQINYVISEQIRPYFGYASYVASRIHHGARIIQGEISLNFKRHGYLFSLLNLIKSKSGNIMSIDDTKKSTASEEKVPVSPLNVVYGADIWSQILSQGISADLAKEVTKKNKLLTEQEVNQSQSSISMTQAAFETKLSGFDINIVFGSNLNAGRSLRWIGADEYSLDYTDGSYADGMVMQEQTGVPVSTGIKLVGVSIAGLAQPINDDGRPLVETYSFQAKDLMILSSIDSNSVETSLAQSTRKKTELASPIKPSGTNYNGRIGNQPYGPEDVRSRR